MGEITKTVIVDESMHALRMRRFLLTIERGDDVKHRIFAQRQVRIGANPDNDVALDDDPAVSRQHARIEVSAEGYRLVDAGSKNGTRVGDMRVQDVFLANGTRFRVGETSITFETTDEEVEVLYSGRTRFGGLVGASMTMREIFGRLDRVSGAETPILFEGKSGTGKEAAADAVHKHSFRRGAEFVVCDASALAADTVERELFGAGDDTPGALQAAAGGSLLIDDIDALPLEAQARLARALQTKSFRPVDGTRDIALEARVFATCDHALSRDVEAGTFREDLYYELSGDHVVLPLLRERAEDIPLLVEHFLEQARARYGNPSLNVTYVTMERLKAHPWPGNVRELRAFLERAVSMASGDGSIDAAPRYVEVEEPEVESARPRDAVDAFMRMAGATTTMPFKDSKARLVEAFERHYWTRLLEQTNGNVSAAGRVAGVHRKSVEYILKKLDIDRKQPRPESKERASRDT